MLLFLLVFVVACLIGLGVSIGDRDIPKLWFYPRNANYRCLFQKEKNSLTKLTPVFFKKKKKNQSVGCTYNTRIQLHKFYLITDLITHVLPFYLGKH